VHQDPSVAASTYDMLGRGYTRRRQPDPRLSQQLYAALGSVRSVLNVGAGAGSYEPNNRRTVAVEPSSVMLAQRPTGAAPAVSARAEALPFGDQAFDAVMGVLTVHHWTDRLAGLAECTRVARERVVLFTWDPSADGFWLVQDYLPEFLVLDRVQFPSMDLLRSTFEAAAKVTVLPVPIPHDCTDGFLGAYWRRPEAYLDPTVQNGISSFGRVDAAEKLQILRTDLASGAWQARHGAVLKFQEYDVGYRIVIAQLRAGRA
jgi:SAM-dependent methyltransferase